MIPMEMEQHAMLSVPGPMQCIAALCKANYSWRAPIMSEAGACLIRVIKSRGGVADRSGPDYDA